MCGPMAGVMMATGARISYMGKESTSGLMVEYIQARTLWIRNTALACTSGRMASDMKDFGPTVNNMDKASSPIKKEKVVLESGKKVHALNGSQALSKSLICRLIIPSSSSK